MDKWKNLLYKQVKLREFVKRKGLPSVEDFDPTLFDEICEHMTTLGYDVPKLIKAYKQRLN